MSLESHSEKSYRLLVENAGEAIVVIQGARIVYANPRTERMFGVENFEVGKVPFFEWVHPEDREEVLDRYHKRLRGEPVVSVSSFRVRSSGGRVFWVEHNTVLIDWNGAPAILSCLADITQRKLFEDALKSLGTGFAHLSGHPFFEAVSRHLATAIHVDYLFIGEYLPATDSITALGGWAKGRPMGELTYGLKGTPCANVMGRTACYYPTGVQSLFPEDLLLAQMGVESYLGAPIFDKEHRAIGIMVALHSGPLQDSAPLLGLFHAFLDRVCAEMLRWRAEAEKERLQSQLDQATKLESIGRLAGGVAHDFNNMLQTILSNVDLAMGEVRDGISLRENLMEIRTAAARATDLTRQLLAYARKQPATPRMLNFTEVGGEVLRMVRRVIRPDIRLDWVAAPDVWSVLMDPLQVDQVLTNLCLNARDAIDGAGVITVQIRNQVLTAADVAGHPGSVPGDHVELILRDTGAGMDAATCARIFEPFFTTKELGKGTGLGLAIVFGIVKQNRGLIEVQSELGRGTTFRLLFPRFDPLPQGSLSGMGRIGAVS